MYTTETETRFSSPCGRPGPSCKIGCPPLFELQTKTDMKPAVQCLVSEECHCENKLESWEAPTTVSDDDDDSCFSH